MSLYGAIEAGGTKIICAVGSGPGDLRNRTRIPTRDPRTTLGEVITFFERAIAEHGPLEAIGLACFGPVDLRPSSATWGHITQTPKPGWSGIDVVGPLLRTFGLPIGFDTDVDGAALAELRWGSASGLGSAVYVTVGTGIGGGAVVEGRPVHGLVHPEIGHVPVPRHPEDSFAGCCPFHGACLEGLASGPALAARWGRPAEELSPDHRAWEIEAHYLGCLAANLAFTLSPERLIFGGGVMQVEGLLDRVRGVLIERLGGYLRSEALEDGAESYLVAPALGTDAGILGAIELARRAAEEHRQPAIRSGG